MCQKKKNTNKTKNKNKKNRVTVRVRQEESRAREAKARSETPASAWLHWAAQSASPERHKVLAEARILRDRVSLLQRFIDKWSYLKFYQCSKIPPITQTTLMD